MHYISWLLNRRTTVQIRTSGALKSDRGLLSYLNSDLHTSLSKNSPNACGVLKPSPNRAEDLFLYFVFDLQSYFWSLNAVTTFLWSSTGIRSAIFLGVFHRILISIYSGLLPNILNLSWTQRLFIRRGSGPLLKVVEYTCYILCNICGLL